MKNIIVENIEEYKEVLENIEEMMKTKMVKPIYEILIMVEKTCDFPLVVSKNWTRSAKNQSTPLSLIQNSVNWSEIREQYINPWYKRKENIGKLYYFWDDIKENGALERLIEYDNNKEYPFKSETTIWRNACAVQDIFEIGTTR